MAQERESLSRRIEMPRRQAVAIESRDSGGCQPDGLNRSNIPSFDRKFTGGIEAMRRVQLRTLAAWSALMLLGTTALAPLSLAEEDPDADSPLAAKDSGLDDQPPPRQLPHFAPRARVEGLFPWPTRTFSLFNSPTSYGMAGRERCMPEMFSPRGIGIARRTSCERMDYSPYVTRFDESNHGPSFYNRIHLRPCQHPHHCERRGAHCGWSYYY